MASGSSLVIVGFQSVAGIPVWGRSAQGFGEGNKRAALLLARWLLDRNGEDGPRFLPAEDRVVADLLVAAAGGGTSSVS